MAELSEWASRTQTAIQNWLDVDDAMSREDYPDAQLLMEDVVGRPFNDLMDELALQPLGMTSSRYAHPLPDALREYAAHGYDTQGAVIGHGWHHYPELAAAGLWTTPSDLARYAIKVQQAYGGARDRILNRALIQLMLLPGDNDWGLGPEISSDHLRFSHGGSNAGFRAHLTAFIDGGAGAVVMTNSDNGDALIAEIFVSLANLYEWPGMQADEKVVVTLSEDEVQAISGTYDLGPLGHVVITIEEGRAMARFGPRTTELRPETASDFFIADTGMDVHFESDNGVVTALLIEGLRGAKLEGGLKVE